MEPIKQAVITCFQKYVSIQGRAARPEYWYWVLFIVISTAIINVVDPKLLATIFALGTLLPGICVGVRRMHDIDKSGWWLLINLIPIVGWIIFIIWAATKGTAGPNRFGAEPVPQAA